MSNEKIMFYLFQKVGTSRVFFKDGNSSPVTIMKIYDNEDKFFLAPLKTHNLNSNIRHPYTILNFYRKGTITKLNNTTYMYYFDNTNFFKGQILTVVSVSKGKGYSGAMKRFKFRGLEETHGVSLKHRSIGSTGQCQDPGKVFKGKRMSGRQGCSKITSNNILVVDIDNNLNVIVIKGLIPGINGGCVYIRKL